MTRRRRRCLDARNIGACGECDACLAAERDAEDRADALDDRAYDWPDGLDWSLPIGWPGA